MIAERQQLLEEICLRALETHPARRAAFLRNACPDDQLRIEVESLLAAADYADALFNVSPALWAGPEDGLSEDPLPAEIGPEIGQEIGPYRLLERLGEGGMGVVYRASQRQPVRREVALKIIRPGMDSGLVAARFGAERQALALMDHPNIARVLDAGTTARERSYFVMELVHGKTITAHCKEAGLTERQRIELMIPVCQAIQHAHQKGIIHRDIKPSNILVARDGGAAIPKVIDFGIAKATAERLHEGATFTRVFDIVGTFAYMSPEQAEPGAGNIDIRSDVYSLGAVLYELLSGAPPLGPLSVREMSYAAIVRRIREEVPAPPSVRCGSSKSAKQLRGECDWIALKALEKDRDRRYESAGDMARDLQRHLSGYAIEAGPPSKLYRARKFAGRYRWALGAAAAFVVVLLAALVWMWIALRQQLRADRDTAALREVVRKIIIERPAQLAQMPNRTALRGELMRDAEGALDVLNRQVRGDDALALDLANAYLALGLARGPYSAEGSEGDPAAAATYIHKAIELYSGLAHRRPADLAVRRGQLEALSTWLHLQYRLGAIEPGKKAGAQLEREIAALPADVRERVQGNWYLSTAYLELGVILWNNGQPREALDLHRKALATLQRAVPAGWAQDPERLAQLSHMQRELAISSWMYDGPGPQAETAARQSVDVLANCSAPVCRMRRAQSAGTLGEIEWGTGQHERGIATLRQSVADFEALSREDPANAIYINAGGQVRAYLALLLGKTGAAAEAIALAEKNLHLRDGADASLQKGRERAMVYRVTLGAALLDGGRFEDALREMRGTLRQNGDWNANYDLRWSALHVMVRALEAQGRFDDALAPAREERKFAKGIGSIGYNLRIVDALAARDFAAAVAGAKTATPADRKAAREALTLCDNLDQRYAVFTGALLETPPTASEVVKLRKLLHE
jgi:tetratricopeptide (TPR) repeat protein